MTENKDKERMAILVYEITRLESLLAARSIVPEPWYARDDAFRKQFIECVEKYMNMKQLPTPEEAHDNWVQAYKDMGWKYGPIRDSEEKTHPDMVPFEKLPKDEQDKDAIFLAVIELVKRLKKIYDGEVDTA